MGIDRRKRSGAAPHDHGDRLADPGAETPAGDALFEEFYRRRSAALLRYGYMLTDSSHDAADLVQEAFARLRVSWRRVRRRSDPEAYVRTTMARLHIGRWRRLRQERVVADVPEAVGEDAALRRLGDDRGLWDGLAILPPRQRAGLVVVLLAVAAGGWRLAIPAPTRVGQLYPATAVSPAPAPDRIDRVVAPPSSPGTIRSVDQVWPEAVTQRFADHQPPHLHARVEGPRPPGHAPGVRRRRRPLTRPWYDTAAGPGAPSGAGCAPYDPRTAYHCRAFGRRTRTRGTGVG
ncbi:sigma factor [Actinocatenispora rupis]|uniref:RNA polymerase sigma-70 region 2 domain-containing protein n=1 Tax=Actinocatenispora rupis TaxID=519421 RepID=A0A8J3NGQ0_9ACTN|nr:sigma factor [Actinocatenispora rupis]GID16220.1 hypothetical protein Aru02nite_71090 [Actinocatenispora rupis]